MKQIRLSYRGFFFIFALVLAVITIKESFGVSRAFAKNSNQIQIASVSQNTLQENSFKANYPVKLIIPSIKMSSKIRMLGKDKQGNMDVPQASTNDVGWYKDGTLPGEVGNAVIGAHVFAAFSKLKNVKLGDDIYILNNQNQKLHFIVADTKTYKLSTLTSETLFEQKDARRLNLITCAGKLTSDRSTYDRRLVVSAIFAGYEKV